MFNFFVCLGVRMDAKSDDIVNIYFTSNKRMYLKGNHTAIFKDYDAPGGEPTETAVVLDVNDPLSTLSTARRLSSFVAADVTTMRYEGEVGIGFASSGTPSPDRCFSSGVCLYTYEEMLFLFDQHNDENGGRRLQSSGGSVSTMTYTEISADSKILAKDDRAGLSRAQGFLEKLLETQAKLTNGTLKINFIMSDLCTNYASLRDDCRSHPAPVVASQVNASDLNDIRPFLGLIAEDNVWMFQDEIEYLLDTSSVQVRVRYAHDPFRDIRRHVVLMDLKNPSRMVTFDEVTVQYDPKNPLLPIFPPQTFITNYNASSSVQSDGTDVFTSGGIDVQTRRRRLDAEEEDHLSKDARRRLVEDAFLGHVRTKIAGFPRISVPEEFLTLSTYTMSESDGSIPLEEVHRRMLNAVGESRNISIDPEVSDQGYCITTMMDEKGNNLPCMSDVEDIHMQMPASYFSNVLIGTLSGSIVWPSLKDVYSIEQFETAEIVFRADLKHLADLHMHNSTLPAPTASPSSPHRHLLSSSPPESMMMISTAMMKFDDHHQEKRIQRHLHKRQSRQDQMRADFEALDQALGRFIDHHRETEHISRSQLAELQEQRRRLSFIDDDALKPYFVNATDARDSASIHANLKISTKMKKKLKVKLPPVVWNQVEKYLNSEVNGYIGQFRVPMRKGSSCAHFHGLMAQLLLGLVDVDDVLMKTISFSNAVNKTLTIIPKLQKKLDGIIEINKLMKPVIGIVSKIPYVGPVAKTFQQVFNSAVTSPITPVKEKLDSIQAKITQYKIKQNNNKYLVNAKKTASGLQNFITGASVVSHGLVTIDDSCLWTPSTVNGVVTYNFTTTGKLCTDLSVPIKAVLNEVNALKAKLNAFLGQIQQLGNLMELALIFDLSFDINIVVTLKDIFGGLFSFLNQWISICIPWICFRSETACTTIYYPCGVSFCCGWYGCWPCGVNWCSYQACVQVPVPYGCSQCAGFSIQQILDGLMSVIDQLQNLIMGALNSLAAALHIQFPTFNFPGLPSLDFLNAIEAYLANLFAAFDTFFDQFNFSFNIILPKINGINWPTICNPKP
jgi:hypothetical protein